MKRIRMLSGILGAGMLLAPMAVAQEQSTAKNSEKSDMQRAIEFQRNEDRAAARQARIEARHPTVFYNGNEADRLQQEDSIRRGHAVPDPGSKQWQKDKRH